MANDTEITFDTDFNEMDSFEKSVLTEVFGAKEAKRLSELEDIDLDPELEELANGIEVDI